MSVDFEDRLTPINRQAFRGMTRGNEPYDMSEYPEHDNRIPTRRYGRVTSKLPKVTQLIMREKKVGLLTILGLAVGSQQIVARCQCGRYVQRPARIIKASKGQGCSRCTPSVIAP